MTQHSVPKIAIIGAGVAGITAARELSAHADVSVFEKSRGVSGRLATRYADPYQFDHGAQYFTARSAEFKAVLAPYIQSGIVQHWPDGQRYAAVPKMNALVKAMMDDLNVHIAERITELIRSDDGWHLSAHSGLFYGPFDLVICAIPAEQAQTLLPQTFSERAALDASKMLPGFTVMVGTDTPWPLDWDYKAFTDSPIASIAVNSSKPGRQTRTSIVIQSDNRWAQTHVDADRDVVMAELLAQFKTLTGMDADNSPHKVIHRWLYANVDVPAGQPFLLDAQQGLAACGDWCIAGRVEAAFQSGLRLAGQVIRDITLVE